MAKNKQTPPGMDGGSLYSRAISGLAQIFEEEDRQKPKQSSRITLEDPQDFVQRSAREGTGVDIAFSSGGLLSKKAIEKAGDPVNLRAEQKALLYVARQRQQYRNRGQA